MRVTDESLKSLKVAKLFKENSDAVNSMDFSNGGEYMITASNDMSIHVYDCMAGRSKKTLYSKKYGCSTIQFTHSKNAALHSSTMLDNKIRYLNLHDNRYLRYFDAHTDTVTSLSMHPQSDVFVSSAKDNTFILWDLRSPSRQAMLQTAQTPICAHDRTGMVVAVGCGSYEMLLYDTSALTQGPFLRFNIPTPHGVEWQHLEFSPDGALMVISTSVNMLIVVDAYDGKVKHTIIDYENTKAASLKASISPDSKYVSIGSTNGSIHIWRLDTGMKVTELQSHPNPTTQVAFNPASFMLASACCNVAFWIPDSEEE